MRADLLEKVFLRLAAAESDDQLERTVGKFLTPTLLKLASPDGEVKKKVGIVRRSFESHLACSTGRNCILISCDFSAACI